MMTFPIFVSRNNLVHGVKGIFQPIDYKRIDITSPNKADTLKGTPGAWIKTMPTKIGKLLDPVGLNTMTGETQQYAGDTIYEGNLFGVSEQKRSHISPSKVHTIPGSYVKTLLKCHEAGMISRTIVAEEYPVRSWLSEFLTMTSFAITKGEDSDRLIRLPLVQKATFLDPPKVHLPTPQLL